MATMTLDSNVITSFGLFPKEKMTSRDNKCIYGVLNKCRTAPGQNLLKTMLQAPLVDKDTIERRLDCVEYFVQNGQIRQGLYDHYLRKVPDLRKLHSKFSSKKMTLTDCYKLYVVVEVLPKMKSLFEEDLTDFIKEAFVDDLDNFIESLSSFREMVVDVIDLKNRDENGECMIKAQFSENLKEVRDQIDECQSEMEKLCQRAADDLGIEEGKVKLEMTDNGFVYRITNNFEKCLRGKDKYTLAGKSKNDGVRFTEKKLKRLNDDYMELKKDYESTQSDILAEFIETAATYADCIKELGDMMSNMDVYTSLAVVAATAANGYVRPKMLDKGSGRLVLKQVRHPCIDAIKSDFIPNDVEFDEKHKFYLITGPNMGGKSTYILSVGICVLLAQIGSFVPAESAEISVIDGIYSRVGASDQQLKGVSTFMTEMLETSHILKSATSDSLVIIDELGRGTSTFDGLGLAWSLTEHISQQIGAFCLFATHYHELTAISKEISTIGNLHVAALTTDDGLTMLYQVQPGVCDQSFGIHVAKIARFPDDIIESAQNKLLELEAPETQADDEQDLDCKIKSLPDVDMMSEQDMRNFIKTL